MTKELKTRQVSKAQQYRIDLRQVTENHNPRNPIPAGTQRATAFDRPYGLFTGESVLHGDMPIKLDLWQLGVSSEPMERSKFCELMEMDEEFVAWAATFLTTGQLEAVELRDNGRKGDKENTYTLVFGARRCLAILYNWAKQGGRGTPWVNAVLAPKVNQTGLLHRSIIENMRQDPNPMETARAIQMAINQQQTEEEVAQTYGRSVSWVKNQLALLALPVDVQKKVEARTLKPTKALEDGKPKSDKAPTVGAKVWKERTERLADVGSRVLAFLEGAAASEMDISLIQQLREAINASK